MLILDFVSQVSLSQAIISVKNAVLAHTHSSGTRPNVKAVLKMLYVMVVLTLKYHQNIGEEPLTQLESSNDWMLMHVKEDTILRIQTQSDVQQAIKATYALNEKSQKITNIREQMTMFE